MDGIDPACRRWAMGTARVEPELANARKRLGKLLLQHDSRVLDCTFKASTGHSEVDI
jgi:hypothetical protein